MALPKSPGTSKDWLMYFRGGLVQRQHLQRSIFESFMHSSTGPSAPSSEQQARDIIGQGILVVGAPFPWVVQACCTILVTLSKLMLHDDTAVNTWASLSYVDRQSERFWKIESFY